MITERPSTVALLDPSLPEVHSSVSVSRSPFYWRRLLGFIGPGFLISVGYMDPGNWATDIAGGSRFGYTLLFVIMASNLMAILLQSLALKLGVATERDLAQMCHEQYGRWASFGLWVGAEIAIAACDLAEVIGSAIALELLFHIPLFYGVLITGLDVLLILLLQRWGFRYVEALVIALIGIILGMFGVQMFLSRPDVWPALHDLFIPSPSIVANPGMLYIAIGILGATVMPHNLYLHSSIVQSRRYKRTPEGKREAIHMANVDSALALTLALFVNAAILIVAAAVFHRSGRFDVAAIQDAYKLLSPMVGAASASTLFAIALLASGQNSSITGTLAGQIVMEGFIHLRVSAWLRRLITRSLAIIPTIIVVAITGRAGDGEVADPEPGDFVAAAQLCRGSAGDVYRQPEEDGRVCERALAAGVFLVHCHSYRGVKCLAAGADGHGPLSKPIPWRLHMTNTRTAGRIVLVFLALTMVNCGLSVAQSGTSSAIAGTVVDETGAALANVAVTASEVDTKAVRAEKTNGDGRFLFSQVNPGTYTVAVRAPGFAEQTSQPVAVEVGRTVTLNLRLTVSSASQTVEVTADQALLSLENPNTTTTLEAKTITNLPNPGQDLTFIAQFSPGALMNTAGSSNDAKAAGGYGNVEFNGLPATSNGYILDGYDTNDPWLGLNIGLSTNLVIGLDAVEQATVNTNSYAVDQGRYGASQVNYFTKSGTNRFHGDLYETWNGSLLNAENYFLHANDTPGDIAKKPRSTVNEFGGSVGGPIRRDRLFFFSHYGGNPDCAAAGVAGGGAHAGLSAICAEPTAGGRDRPDYGNRCCRPSPRRRTFYRSMFGLYRNTAGTPVAVSSCPLDANGAPLPGSAAPTAAAAPTSGRSR